MRNLHVVVTPEKGIQIVEETTGPYSHSEPIKTILFEMTAEEAAPVKAELEKT